MAVTVVESDELFTSTTFRLAKGFRKDHKGNLILWGEHSRTIAMFSPGSWRSVRFDDAEA